MAPDVSERPNEATAGARTAQANGAGSPAAGSSLSGFKDIKPPAISLPKGGGAIRGMGEKFAANPVTGTGSMSVPLSLSPGRAGFGPQLSLSYDSGSGNGPFGFGWNLSLPAVTRKTDKGLPRYRDAEESDVFILSGAEDLVPVYKRKDDGRWEIDGDGKFVIDDHDDPEERYAIRTYRPRTEGLFARIERWTNKNDANDVSWRSISKDNITTWYGRTGNSRIADPNDATRIFSWLICRSWDDKGNAIVYEYAEENGDGVRDDAQGLPRDSAHEANRDERGRTANRYLKRVKYGNLAPNRDGQWRPTDPAPLTDWMFEAVFDYGEGHFSSAPAANKNEHEYATACSAAPADKKWPARQDPFSSYRSGFEVRTYRLCRRVLMFHRFLDQPGWPREDACLVRSTEFSYDEGRIGSFLALVTQSGYVYDRGKAKYLKKSMPPLEFRYSRARLGAEVKELDAESLENLPGGLDGSLFQWVDLDGEGVSGVLTEQAGAWHYKPNLGGGRFGPSRAVSLRPSLAHLGSGRQQLLDLAGDGRLDVVDFSGPVPGFFERTVEETWDQFRPFRSLPNIDWGDPNLKFVDLTGDGFADVLIAEDEVIAWHPSLAEDGFGPAERVRQALEEERGPRLVFADGTQSVYLADLSGDGLSDLARVRNGEVCYWPNLGYGRFGAKVTMDNPPRFDAPDLFDQRRLRLADIDGSGTTDLIYLAGGEVRIYRNECGNAWSEPETLAGFPAVDNVSSVQALDLFGSGTACLVWSSPLPADGRRPVRYIDLMAEGKPHLLVSTVNNPGAETYVRYAPSTDFYLADKNAGRPWITRLPFPVHAVKQVETIDRVSRNRFVTRYAYHHGHFDGEEREFRGFGMVEQWDTEEPAEGADGVPAANEGGWSRVPPVLTKTWFHTGVFLGRGRVSNFFAGLLDENDAGEYYREPCPDGENADARAAALLLPDTVLPGGLTAEEEREACRALKGSMLRQEIYALDGPEKEGIPYAVTEQNFTLKRLQPRGGNKHAVFFAHPREALNYHYERDPADPRVSHALTLEADDYGNVLKSASIGYGRRRTIVRPDDGGRLVEIPNPGLAELENLGADDEKKQTITLVTYTENKFTKAVGEKAGESPDDYRAPLICEARTFELTGPDLSDRAERFRFEEWLDKDNNIELAWALPEINYEDDPDPSKKQRRLIEHLRTVYRKNDLSGALKLGELQSLALPGEAYKLAFTPGLLDAVYKRRKPDGTELKLLDDADKVLTDEGGYRDSRSLRTAGAFPPDSGDPLWTKSDEDGHWWIPSGLAFFSPGPNDGPETELAFARSHFFLPQRFRDPFHSVANNTETILTYDAFHLLVVETTDPLANSVKAENDYRVLQPRLITDPNGCQTEAAFDALGLVAATAVTGKNGESGDTVEGVKADLTLGDLEDFFSDPRGRAAGFLNKATTRIVYDLNRFRRMRNAATAEPAFWRPVYASTLARERHVRDDSRSPIQVSFSYSDGFGREIQKKIQAEKGKVPVRDAGGRIVVDENNRPKMSADEREPRWVGSGWTVFNNKGKPVRQFEPFFSDTHECDTEACIGVSPILCYDPVERALATLHPNHTHEKVLFDPWRQTTWDVNDTVLTDPSGDDDLRAFFFDERGGRRIPEDWYSPIWYTRKTQATASDADKAAAHKAAVHAGTPSVAYLDTLGRTFMSVADNGKDGNGKSLLFRTRTDLDIEGNQRAVRDERRKPDDSPEQRLVMRYRYFLAGPEQSEEKKSTNLINQASMEASERWVLNDVSGKPVRMWDDRGFARRLTYDQLRRPVSLFVTERGAEREAERTTYGESLGAAAGKADNLLTRVYQFRDGAGAVTNLKYDFKGNLLRTKRELLTDYKTAVDWSKNPALDAEEFETSTEYDALNRPTAVATPDSSVYRPAYNEANLLEKVEVSLRGAAPTLFVTNIDYNAKGQRELIAYANGAETAYDYDRDTFRLIGLKTTRPAGRNGQSGKLFKDPSIVQDLRYAYDPAGNITQMADEALVARVNDGETVAPVCGYTYDPVYRLIEATGREHSAQAEFIPSPPDNNRRDHPFTGTRVSPLDLQAVRGYTETYEYDEVGNFIALHHIMKNSNWHRLYEYNEPSLLEPGGKNNRLTKTTVGDGAAMEEKYSYVDAQGGDVHGCMTSIDTMKMTWDFKDQLQKVDLIGGGTAYYVYDTSGQRVRKVIEAQPGASRKERIYLGGYEVYREYNGAPEPRLERQSLHVMDDKQRIALVETRVKGTEAGVPERLIRCQLANHLGSACLELDEDANLITYEEYFPYGGTSFQCAASGRETPAKRYRYTGKERDEETGLDYYGARYYASWLGRWTSCDPAPIILKNNDSQVKSKKPESSQKNTLLFRFSSDKERNVDYGDINLYIYVNGNPINYFDEIGLYEVAPNTKANRRIKSEVGEKIIELFENSTTRKAIEGKGFSKKGYFFDSKRYAKETGTGVNVRLKPFGDTTKKMNYLTPKAASKDKYSGNTYCAAVTWQYAVKAIEEINAESNNYSFGKIAANDYNALLKFQQIWYRAVESKGAPQALVDFNLGYYVKDIAKDLHPGAVVQTMKGSGHSFIFLEYEKAFSFKLFLQNPFSPSKWYIDKGNIKAISQGIEVTYSVEELKDKKAVAANWLPTKRQVE